MTRTMTLTVLLAVSTVVALAQAPAPEARWLDPDRTEPAGTTYRTFTSGKAGGAVSYLMYLPPGYDTSGATRYPVVYWLHGVGGSQRSGASFITHLDAAIRSVSILAGALLDDESVATTRPELFAKNFGSNRAYFHAGSPWGGGGAERCRHSRKDGGADWRRRA